MVLTPTSYNYRRQKSNLCECLCKIGVKINGNLYNVIIDLFIFHLLTYSFHYDLLFSLRNTNIASFLTFLNVLSGLPRKYPCP
jgi:hypothetical protein